MATINPFDKVLGALSSGRSGQKTASFELYKLPLGHTDICAQCGSPIELREMLDYKARPFRYWSDCPCIGKAADRAAERRNSRARCRPISVWRLSATLYRLARSRWKR